MRHVFSLLLLASFMGCAPDAGAQYQTRSWLPWRTIQAGRFAVHFPAELEPWARTVAGRVRGIDSTVSAAVGFEPTQRIDVVIDDPFRLPNGSAWPLIDEPAMVLWATPPSPREDIGTFVSWADMLATHEYAHLAHLLRPTRNPWQSLLWQLAPVELGPISRKAPRWLIEGYATYLEGRVTGSGRPNGVWRPTILRQWAVEGALPTYTQLDAMNGMYGGDFAYLAGSSFIEWLTARRGDSSVVLLWRRMSARRDRGFTEAFTGVYGEPPDILYGRFAAEVTASAKQMEAETRAASADSGTTIQHLGRETGDPAISHDGGRAAIMLASATRPGRVVIWRTIAEPDSLAAREAAMLRQRDPDDVAPYRPFPPPKRALATLHAVGNQPYQDPRFFRDGRVLVWRNSAIGDGSWAPDLYSWDPQRGSVQRLTRRANVRQGDPSPDGGSIAATQCAAGKCDLVQVDARTGSVAVVAEGSDTRSFNRPRFAPNGQLVAVAVRDSGFWRVGIFNIADRSLRLITPDRRNHFDPAFLDDSTLVATSDEGGVLNVVRLAVSGRALGRLTNATGAAIAGEPNHADGTIWFLALHARGWDVRAAPSAGPFPALAVSRIDSASPRVLPTSPAGPTTSYAPDRKWVYFPGGSFVRDAGSLMLGLANTDPAGRHELLVQGAASLSPGAVNGPWQGFSATLTTRARVARTISLFTIEQDGAFHSAVRGASLSAEYLRRTERASQRALVGGMFGGVSNPDVEPNSRRWVSFAEISGSATRYRGARRTTAQLTIHGATGRHASDRVARGLLTGTIASTEIPITITAQAGLSQAEAPAEQFIIGGHPPTMVPPGVLSQYIAQPALSPFFVGKRLETFRVAIPFAGLRLYAWSGRAYDGGSPPPPFEHVVGAELSGAIGAIAALGTPAARATVGIGRWNNRRDVARAYDGPVYVAPRSPVQFYVTTQFGDWTR